MNRRLRRRTVTRGDVSLDVEDELGPDDWPKLSDISSSLLRYSVHLPLEPKVRTERKRHHEKCSNVLLYSHVPSISNCSNINDGQEVTKQQKLPTEE